jgi:outer membrane receptor protein involved in Fe transport
MIVGLGVLAGPVGALAQEATKTTDDGTQITDIVVTAEKRSENLRDVPASISALSGAVLEQQHIDNYDDISRTVPGISFSAGSGSVAGAGVGAESIEIRGIGSNVGSATVGLYVDGVPVTTPTQAGTFAPKIFDLDRVEVLRGPQGTLYGASSEGGTVRFLTRQPDLDNYEFTVSSDLSGTLHGGLNTDDRAIANIPIIAGQLAIRAGLEFTGQSGWIDRYEHADEDLSDRTDNLIKGDSNAERDFALHVAATYQPSPDLTITPALIYQREYQDDTPAFFFGDGTYNQAKSIAEYARDVDFIPSLTIDKDLGWAKVTSVSSYLYRGYDRARDGTYFDPDYVVPDCLDVNFGCGNAPPSTVYNTGAQSTQADALLSTLPTTSTDQERTSVTTEELRLTSPARADSGLPFSWVGGLYYSSILDKLNHNEVTPGWNSLFEQVYGFSPNNPSLSPLADVTDPNAWNNDFYFFETSRGYDQYAAFAQGEYAILPDLIATVGLRYQITDLTYSRFGAGFYDIGVQHSFSSSAEDYALTPKFSLKYELSDTSNLYATAAKGYRDAGVNDPVNQLLCAPYEKQIGLSGTPPGSFGPDKLWSYELGSKNLLADRQLSLNVDGYYIQWSKIQQQILIPTCAFDFISNVGDAEAYGSELELQYNLPFVKGLTLGLNSSVEKTRITSSTGNGAAAVGQQLLFTPQWTTTVSGNYSFQVMQDAVAFIRTDYDWTGRSHGDFVQSTTDYNNKQYGVLNASFGVSFDDGLDVQLYAKNLLDSVTVIREPTIADVTEAYTVPPLTIGLKVTKSF